MNQNLYETVFEPNFVEDVKYWKKEDPENYNKIKLLVKAISVNPFEGIGKPKRLNKRYLGYQAWSRRINQEQRLIYTVRESRITFLKCRYHYDI